MIQGKVRSFDEQKGFGFISSPGLPDTFVFFSAINGGGFKSLTPGQLVEFQIVQGENGPQAVNVEVLDEDSDGSLETDDTHNR